jgi:hypothetical protein
MLITLWRFKVTNYLDIRAANSLYYRVSINTRTSCPYLEYVLQHTIWQHYIQCISRLIELKISVKHPTFSFVHGLNKKNYSVTGISVHYQPFIVSKRKASLQLPPNLLIISHYGHFCLLLSTCLFLSLQLRSYFIISSRL